MVGKYGEPMNNEATQRLLFAQLTRGMQQKKFDFIIAGAGLAGLTLALEMARRPAFLGKKILLLDRSAKLENDRTWCSWASADELPTLLQTGVEPLKSWPAFDFFGEKIERRLSIEPYRYFLIRGIDFYENAHQKLSQLVDFQWITTNIISIENEAGEVKTEAGIFSADLIFSSFFELEKLHAPLLQHFKGWKIRTPTAHFEPEKAMTFMDFRIEQADETRFVYVVPLAKNEAMVEFTVFSPSVLEAKNYDDELRNYLTNFLKIKELEVVEEEFGVIPMTDFRFPNTQNGRVIFIGTTGGFVKGSSGYAFKRTQEKIRRLLDFYEKTGRFEPSVMASRWIFRVLDAIFLNVLLKKRTSQRAIFSALFRKNEAASVLRFLDEKTGVFETLRVILSCPTAPFFRAFLSILPRIFKL